MHAVAHTCVRMHTPIHTLTHPQPPPIQKLGVVLSSQNPLHFVHRNSQLGVPTGPYRIAKCSVRRQEKIGI